MTPKDQVGTATDNLKMGAGLTLLLGLLFVLAVLFYPNRPHELVVLTCLIAAALLLPGTTLIVWLIREHDSSQGEARQDREYLALGLNYCWWCLALVLSIFIGAEGFWQLARKYPDFAIALAAAAALLAIGLIGIRKPRSSTRELVKAVVREEIRSGGPLALVPLDQSVKATPPQLPNFQVTFPDMRRLLVHQAARLLAYKDSPLLRDESFSADIDLNRRTAAIFSAHSTYQTPEFLFWRLHLLLIGSAAEQVLLGATSTAAFDDLQEFTTVADAYLQLAYNTPAPHKASTPAELNLRNQRYELLRKQAFQRCLAAIQDNRSTLAALIAKLESQPVVGARDIRPILEVATLPHGFPVATDDLDAALVNFEAALQLTHEDPMEQSVEQAPSIQNETPVQKASPEPEAGSASEPKSTSRRSARPEVITDTQETGSDLQAGRIVH